MKYGAGTEVNTDISSRLDVRMLREAPVVRTVQQEETTTEAQGEKEAQTEILTGGDREVSKGRAPPPLVDEHSSKAPQGASKAINEGVVQYSTYPLLVLDVYVHLPQTELKTRDVIHKEKKQGRQKSAQDQEKKEMKALVQAAKHKNQIFGLDIHQVVGLFTLNSERQPPNLDLGLFSWEHFQFQAGLQKGGKEKSNPYAKTPTEPVPEGTVVQKDRTWSQPNSISSTITYKAKLSTGREFQMLLLGNTLSREMMDEVLPKRVRQWIGMPKEEDWFA